MTVRLKIIRIYAWNVPHVHEHKRLDDDAKCNISIMCEVKENQVYLNCALICCQTQESLSAGHFQNSITMFGARL